MYLLSFSILLLWVFWKYTAACSPGVRDLRTAFLIMLQIIEGLSPCGVLKGSVWQNFCGYTAPISWTFWAVKCSFWSTSMAMVTAEPLGFQVFPAWQGCLFPQFFLPSICWVIFQKWLNLFWLLCKKGKGSVCWDPGIKAAVCNLRPSQFSQNWGSTLRRGWCWGWTLRLCKGVLLCCCRCRWFIEALVDCPKTDNIPVPHPGRFWIKQEHLRSLSAAWYLV